MIRYDTICRVFVREFSICRVFVFGSWKVSEEGHKLYDEKNYRLREKSTFKTWNYYVFVCSRFSHDRAVIAAAAAR